MTVAVPHGPAASPRTIVVALSGGVDSAAAAALLVRAGHRVLGMTMRLYDARGTAGARGRCCGPRDIEDARRVAEHLDIPFYVIDLEAEFGAAVVDDFVATYLDGRTPNPCVRCNQHLKFAPLLAQAQAIGADLLATGHYGRVAPGPDGAPALWRAIDDDKDQSYFLFSMPAAALARVVFPLGGLTKPAVRALAAELGLPNAAKPESQEICFIPDGDHAGFVAAAALKRGRPLPTAGAIVDDRGAVLGHHAGVHRFTIGQHRGLGNLGRRPRRSPLRHRADPAAGTVVGARAQATTAAFTLDEPRWLGPLGDGLTVQVRHRGARVPAEVTVDAEVRVTLAEPVTAAPGQAAVIYAGDRVVGGGWVARPRVG
jgi:tRNA-specific 2-thiouridylase